MHESGTEELPVAVPFTISDYEIESLEGFVSLLVEQYPPAGFCLEMVMYTRFDPDFQSKEKYKIMFGAKDTSGAMVHTVYEYQQSRHGDKMTPYKLPIPNMKTWIPANPKVKGFEDKYLSAAVSCYHSMITFHTLNHSYVK